MIELISILLGQEMNHQTVVLSLKSSTMALYSVLTAKGTGLGSGKNNIKLAIADGGDGAFDSAVFIKADTFSSTPPTQSVPEPTTILGLVAVCGFGFRSSKKRKSK